MQGCCLAGLLRCDPHQPTQPPSLLNGTLLAYANADALSIPVASTRCKQFDAGHYRHPIAPDVKTLRLAHTIAPDVKTLRLAHPIAPDVKTLRLAHPIAFPDYPRASCHSRAQEGDWPPRPCFGCRPGNLTADRRTS